MKFKEHCWILSEFWNMCNGKIVSISVKMNHLLNIYSYLHVIVHSFSTFSQAPENRRTSKTCFFGSQFTSHHNSRVRFWTGNYRYEFKQEMVNCNRRKLAMEVAQIKIQYSFWPEANIKYDSLKLFVKFENSSNM